MTEGVFATSRGRGSPGGDRSLTVAAFSSPRSSALRSAGSQGDVGSGMARALPLLVCFPNWGRTRSLLGAQEAMVGRIGLAAAGDDDELASTGSAGLPRHRPFNASKKERSNVGRWMKTSSKG